MKFILIIVSFYGGMLKIPMESEKHCKENAKIINSNDVWSPKYAHAYCIKKREED